MSTPKRPVRIANCSGAAGDPGDYMLAQAQSGQVDVITGDYLAEVNLAQYAEAHASGAHPGYAATALDGLQKALPLINERRIKVVINGGALNPAGLARIVNQVALDAKYNLKLAFVDGDNLLSRIEELLGINGQGIAHFDSENPNVKLPKNVTEFFSNSEKKIVSANAYLGCRAIYEGLKRGADIIICGRVADASPVMGAAMWWHDWKDDNFDALAGSLVAGHLVECSTYVTGGNFAGFTQYETSELLGLSCPIAEVDANGDCIITKHDKLHGFITEDTVKCQLLYELQGNIYLNSDVKADLAHVTVKQVGENRVKVSGTKGFPPPPTTKLAIFSKGGFQGELTINATGYATSKKLDLMEAQLRSKLAEWRLLDQIDLLDFQRVGVPQVNPKSQLASTTYLRIFAQASKSDTIIQIFRAFIYNGMQHFSGMNGTLDFRLMTPLPFLAYYPALIPQSELQESVVILDSSDAERRIKIGPPQLTEPLSGRENYDPKSPIDLSAFGPTREAPLGDVALARSGDKGGNINIGLFVQGDEEWKWLRSFLTRAKLQELMGEDWESWFFIERVELADIRAVHFVIYGALGRGVSSSAKLDCLAKGFADFIRYVHVPVPEKFLRS